MSDTSNGICKQVGCGCIFYGWNFLEILFSRDGAKRVIEDILKFIIHEKIEFVV